MGVVDEIQPGMAMPALVVTPTSRDLVVWAAATGDFYEAHYDLEYCQSHGLPGVIVHGTLKLAYFARAITEWAGPNCFVRRISAEYRGMDLVNKPFTVRGEVTEVARDGDLLVATVRLTGVSADGAATTFGTATFDLPLPKQER